MTPPSEAPVGQAIEAARFIEALHTKADYFRRLRPDQRNELEQMFVAIDDALLSLHAQNERLQGAISSAAGALLAGHDDRAYQILGEALMEPKP